MNYQERVSTRADVRALYERVVQDPTIARYRGYTANRSYGWDVRSGDYFKREGECWFDNPAYDPEHVTEGEAMENAELLDERLEENARCIEALNAERTELRALIDTLDERIASLEQDVASITAERDEALGALAALREALQAIRKLTEVA